MGKDGVGIDLSSLFLVEGSGDSEADQGTLNLFQDVNMGITEGHDDDDDDAESCSCDSSESLEFLEVLDSGDQACFSSSTNDVDEEIFGDPSRNNCKMWWSGIAGLPNVEGEEEESKLGNYREIMDQMEDKLFWETCMAIGYP